MIVALAVALIVASLGLTAAALGWAALDRPIRIGHLALAAAIEIALLVQTVVAVVRLVAGNRPESVPTFVAYLAGSLVILPLGVLWALEERTRWSSVVLAVAAVTLAVVVVRLNMVWNTRV